MKDYEKFKHLLEYFVCHLEYLASSENPSVRGYNDYLKSLIDDKTFKRSGQGYNNGSIQNQVKDWANCHNCCNICINITTFNLQARTNYLNWYNTGVNIRPIWQGNSIEELKILIWDKADGPDILKNSIKELGLFDKQLSNDKLKKFFDKYEEVYFDYIGEPKFSKYVYLLTSNHNLILTGAPGTGKTYLAKQIAAQMISHQLDFDKLSENDKKKKFEDCTAFVQFHPSYDYTDFVEGLRPDNQNGTIVFKRKNGVFKELCREAIRQPEQKFVMIIDEINRGEISKIFGELFFSIDPGYRGENGRVKTQYQNLIPENDLFYKGFYVPENVYIIGTMNDIDRSVESMDFAIRRRFAWVEIKADENTGMLDVFGDKKDDIVQRMKSLNEAISKVEGLNDAYHIGAAYFLKLKGYLADDEKNYSKANNDSYDWENAYNSLWNNHLKGLLKEYLRGMPKADNELKKLENAYNLENTDGNQDQQ